jgi:hypothetical protein
MDRGSADRREVIGALVRLLDSLPLEITVIVQCQPVCSSTFTIPRAIPPTHALDFRSVTVGSEVYDFNDSQAKAVKLLWEAWEDGSPEVGLATLLETAGVERTGRLRDLFRSNQKQHKAWGKLIVPGRGTGTFRLSFGDSPARD